MEHFKILHKNLRLFEKKKTHGSCDMIDFKTENEPKMNMFDFEAF